MILSAASVLLLGFLLATGSGPLAPVVALAVLAAAAALEALAVPLPGFGF